MRRAALEIASKLRASRRCYPEGKVRGSRGENTATREAVIEVSPSTLPVVGRNNVL